MFAIIGFGLAFASLLFGYTTARQFVRARLRYVDALHSLSAPIVAGFGAALIALFPFTLIPLPFFSAGTAILFGVSVGVGVRAGSKDVRGATGYIEGP